MFEHQPESLRERVKQLSAAAIAKSDPTSWFEQLYVAAAGDPALIPWAQSAPHPHIQDWLDQHDVVGSGQRALMVGCGLGDDAEDLQRRGFQVTAFDIAPSAIDWCKARWPDTAVNYQVADLLAPPLAWQQSYDLVVECRNIQALPLNLRSLAIASIAQCVAPQGTLLVVTRLRADEAAPAGPPWPLSESELTQFTRLGLAERRRRVFVLGEAPSLSQAWVEFGLTPP